MKIRLPSVSVPHLDLPTSLRRPCQNPVYLLIYLHHRRGATGAEALGGEQGEFAVGGGVAYLWA